MKSGYIKYLLALLVLVLPLQAAMGSSRLDSAVDNGEYVGNVDDEYENRHEGPGVILYRHAAFKGGGVFIPSGRDIRDLRSEGLNDEISSVEIIGGATAIIFEDKNYIGASARITRSIADLVRFDSDVEGGNWNDRISSMKVFGGRGYFSQGKADDRDDYYSQKKADDEGIKCIFYADNRPNSPSLRGYLGKHETIKKKWNDRIRVVWLKRGYVLTLFDHADFRGESLVLEGKTRGGELFDLERYGFSYRASSYLLEKGRRF